MKQSMFGPLRQILFQKSPNMRPGSIARLQLHDVHADGSVVGLGVVRPSSKGGHRVELRGVVELGLEQLVGDGRLGGQVLVVEVEVFPGVGKVIF